MANLHHTHPKIDFLKLQLESIGSDSSIYVYLFTGEEISPSELSECKSQLEVLAPVPVKILNGDEDLNSVSNDDRKIGIILESQVIFEPSFFENLFFVFKNTDTFCLYSDFYQTADEVVFEKKLPAWSPIRFASVDYLGPVLAFDLATYLNSTKSTLVTREKIIEFAQVNNMRISRIPIPLYKGMAKFSRKEIATNNFLAPETVSLVIPTQGLVSTNYSLLETCASGLAEQIGVPSIELIVVADEGYDEDLISRIEQMLPKNFSFKLIEFNESFNFSRKCNIGASEATGEVVVFLNDDVELLSPDAIAKLSSWSLLNGVGAVGSQLQFADGSIQHAGITLREAKPRNSYLDQYPRVTDFGDLEIPHEVSGVTGACLVVKREVFNQAGGWNEDLPNSYNDVDLCLRLNNMGLQSVVLNELKIIHNESSTRNSDFAIKSFEILKKAWPDDLTSERYLRSAEANGEHPGPWGSQRDERIDLEGRYISYGIHLLRKYGLVVTFKQLISRVSGRTHRIVNVPRHEYL